MGCNEIISVFLCVGQERVRFLRSLIVLGVLVGVDIYNDSNRESLDKETSNSDYFMSDILIAEVSDKDKQRE